MLYFLQALCHTANNTVLTLNGVFHVENFAMKYLKFFFFSCNIKKSVHTLKKIESSSGAYLCAVFVSMNRSLSSKVLVIHKKFNIHMYLCRILTLNEH